jgi:hypothetical protein
MYFQAHEGAEQVPTLYGSFIGTLGEALTPEIEEFLKQVRERPWNFKKLLLVVSLHPEPAESPIWNKQTFTLGRATRYLVDEIVMSGVLADDILYELRRVLKRFENEKRGASFKQQIDAEWQLANEMINTAERLGNVLLRPFIMDPLLLPTPDAQKLCKLAQDFARKMLPADLVGRIMKSEASEAHLTRLGRFLRTYAERLQQKDPHFREVVKVARRWEKERQQRKQKRS